MISIGRIFIWSGRFLLAGLVIFIAKTAFDLQPVGEDFRAARSQTAHVQILDRSGIPLTFSYQNRWNSYDHAALHQIPESLQHAFVLSEDRRFFDHGGVDWVARSHALWQRVWHGKRARGASTISEQVVRMLHPRPRTYWSKWIEGLEAMMLEAHASKADILEFYLNQVPYGANRRGVTQAARYYFNRDINTLNPKEMLALAVLVRAPSKFDLYRGEVDIAGSIKRLADVMAQRGLLDSQVVERLTQYQLALEPAASPVEAFHFVNDVRQQAAAAATWNQSRILTTLDGNLQQYLGDLLQSRLQSLAAKRVHNAAAIVIDNTTNEVLAWVSAGAECSKSNHNAAGCRIDMVRTPRQPGSALKPFLYAAALEKGWTAATIIDDAPYSNSIGRGLHHFRNYSNRYYGEVSLRAALGNSLNIPALHTINFVRPDAYLALLHQLGFDSLTQSHDFYDDGLALGNGEVSLFELAQAYVALANKGEYTPLKTILYHEAPVQSRQIFSSEVASLIGDILSDPWARQLEFGRSSVLNLPVQTAAKTGTSTDYRDAWAVGYNHRYTVAIWMGNADYTPTDGITGSLGPSLVLRSVFNELSLHGDSAPLYVSPKLVAKDICIAAQAQLPDCATRTEYFMPDTPLLPAPKTQQNIAIARPADGLEMAVDPRIPHEKQAFEMRLSGAILPSDEVEWFIDESKQDHASGARYLWPTAKGQHSVQALVWRDGELWSKTAKHQFQVK